MITIAKSTYGYCIQNTFVDPMKEAKDLLYSLIAFLEQQFQDWDYMYVSKEKQKFYPIVLNDIEHMKQEIETDQTMVFMDSFDTDVYRKPLLTKPVYKFVKKSRIIYSFDSCVLIKFYQTYPFNVPSLGSSQPCLRAAELSPFLRKRGALKSDNLIRPDPITRFSLSIFFRQIKANFLPCLRRI